MPFLTHGMVRMVGDEHGLAKWKREGLDWRKAHPETHPREYDAAKFRGNQVSNDPHESGRLMAGEAHNRMMHSSASVRRAASYEREVSVSGKHVGEIQSVLSMYRDMDAEDGGSDLRRQRTRTLMKDKKNLEKGMKSELKKKLIAQGTIADPKKEERKVRQREKLTGKKAGRSAGE